MVGFNPVTTSLVDQLRLLVGKENILTGPEEKEAYSCDEMCQPRPHLPEVVVKPTGTAAVSRVLALANEAHVPVTPRGGGTGLSGGAIPTFGGILMSLEKMDHIIEIDEANLMAVVQPGVPLVQLYQAVESRGLYYPLYPGEKTAHIGGTVATNAGGMKAIRYGVTRNWVLGLEAVLPTGHVIRTGGKLVKCTTGYDLTQLLVGSEGTLAVITQVTLRLTTPPAVKELLFVPFTGLDQAIGAVPEIRRQKAPLAGLEFLERDAIELMEGFVGKELPLHEHPAFLLAILEGESPEEVYQGAKRVADVCTRNGALDIYVPPSERAKSELLEAREKLYHALKRTGPTEIADVVVPPSRIAEFVARVKDISRRYGLPILAYGHAGDGNVHLHPLGKGLRVEEWERKLPLVMEEMYRAGIALGGAISGEHGLGLDKRKYLGMVMDQGQIDLLARLKTAFDPNHILNPGKIFEQD